MNASYDESTRTGAPASSYRGLIILLGTMAALGPMTTDMYLPALPQMARDFATNEAAIQTTLTGSLLGMAFGSLLFGPISDAVGRRIPLLTGLVVHIVFSVLSAFAGGVPSLIVFRTLQGIGSAAAPSIAIAIVRDVFVGKAASVRYSTIMLVAMAAPIVAPLIGSAILLATDWHGIFIAQGAMSLILTALAIFVLPETKTEGRRSVFQARVFSGARQLFTDRVFVGASLSQCSMMAASFCYISGLSFVAQDWYGVSQQVYGAILAGGAFVMAFMNPISPLLLRRFSSHRVQVIGLIGALCSSLLIVASAFTVGLVGVTIFAWLCIGFQQFMIPNNQAMALLKHPSRAGFGAAIVGSAGMVGAAISAPLLGLAGTDNGMNMGIGMFLFYLISLASSLFIIGFRKHSGEDAAVLA